MKKKSYSANRLLHLEKISFSIEAQKLRKQNSNRKMFNQIKHQQSSSKKRLLSSIQIKKNIGNFLQPTRIISASAHKWVIYDFFTMKYIRGYRAHNKAQLGVFSKLLVFCTINTLIKKHKLDPRKFQTIITSSVLKMFPKQKRYKNDDIVSLQDILNLMILEESQIYQVIVSANVGAYLYKKHKNQYYSVYDVNQKTLKDHLKYFYQLVNSYCSLMHLQNVKYVESDPMLRKQSNYGSAADIARLSIQCLNIPSFLQILKKIQHTCQIKYVDQKGHLSSKYFKVFNKAVENKFIPYVNVCRNWQDKQFLSSHCSIKYQDQNIGFRPVIVVLLGSYSPKDRQKDIQQIVQWYLKSQNLLNPQKEVQSIHTKILKTQPVQREDDALQRKLQQKLSMKKSSKYDILGLRQSKNDLHRDKKSISILDDSKMISLIDDKKVLISEDKKIQIQNKKPLFDYKKIRTRKITNIKTQQSL